MALELITGPPNAGRAGAILDRFVATIGSDPVLVVPTSDDVDRFERELCERPGGGLGGIVTTFPGLFREVATAAELGDAGALTRMQRLWLCRAAARAGSLDLLARSAPREGFAPALERLLEELQSAGLDAASFDALIDELGDGGAYEREIAALFAGYEGLRDGLGRGDEHLAAAAATGALRADPGCWRGRQVLLYGFDDLSREQIELVAALGEACTVTIAVTFEPGRAALAARAELFEVLREELGAVPGPALPADAANTVSDTLFELERRLFDPDAEPISRPDDLFLLEAAGERGEIELIGRRIAGLLASGCEPDEIAIAVRSPDRQALPMVRILGRIGLPIAAEARVPIAATATGATLLRLLRIAAGEGDAADVIAFLRGRTGNPDSVDWLERRVRRLRITSAEEALESWGHPGERTIGPLSQLIAASGNPGEIAAAVSRIAANLAERPHRRKQPVPSAADAIELRAQAEIARACAELAELGSLAPDLGEVAEMLGHIRVPLWRGPTEGRIRILSPQRLRAGRIDHLFVPGLVDGAFPAPAGNEPLLGEERRRALGIAARRDNQSEERYLFHTCVSRPRRTLTLSYPIADESGAPVPRSPFVDELRALLSPPPPPDPADDELEASIRQRIGLGEIAPPPELACSTHELARALAALPEPEAERRLQALELPITKAAQSLALARKARMRIELASRPGPMTDENVLAVLSGRQIFGASTLEQYDSCSYRWFVQNELRPEPIAPPPDPLETGGLVHAVLEDLYREPPAGSGARPTTENVDAWISAAADLLRRHATEQEWKPEAARTAIQLSRLDAVLATYLRRDAETGGPMAPRPDLLEAAFGPGPDDDFPAAEIGSFQLHGRIDRIDASSNGKALIRDYKLSRKVIAANKLIEEGKLQLPLYIQAVRGMGLDPIGGLYHPLGARPGEDRPRGMLAADEKGALIPGEKEAHVRTDFLSDEDFEEIISKGVARADEIVGSIRAGAITRNPRKDECPDYCAFGPICRRERGVVEDEDEMDGER